MDKTSVILGSILIALGVVTCYLSVYITDFVMMFEILDFKSMFAECMKFMLCMSGGVLLSSFGIISIIWSIRDEKYNTK